MVPALSLTGKAYCITLINSPKTVGGLLVSSITLPDYDATESVTVERSSDTTACGIW